MKRFLCGLLAFCLAASMAGCSSGGKGESSQTPDSTTAAPTADGSRPHAEVTQAPETETPHQEDPTEQTDKKPGTTAGRPTQKPTAPPTKAPTTALPTAAPTTGVQPSKGDKDMYQHIFDTETAWLASSQLDNGALPMVKTENGSANLNPYFSDFAALALLDNAKKYGGNVKRYMDWHISHLNTAEEDQNKLDGTIYDYVASISKGHVTGEKIVVTETGRKHYDSTDSYAATFLCVMEKYMRKTGDKAYIVKHKKDVERIINAMYATLDDGLTYAKPDYRIQYLMDNCEVYEGGMAAVELLKKAIVPADSSYQKLLTTCENYAVLVKDSIEKHLWNKKKNSYDWALYNTANWNNYYADATAQTFPISCGLISPDSERAIHLYGEFCKHYNWENFEYPDVFYWGSNVLTAAKMGDTERVNTYFKGYQKIMKSHAYPLFNADIGKACMAAYEMLNR